MSNTNLLYRSETATLTPPQTNQKVVITSESGRLKVASVIPVYSTPAYAANSCAQIFAELFLSSTQTPEGLPLFLLASGYIGGSHALGWAGDIPLSSSMSIFCRWYTTIDSQIQLTVGVEK